MEWEILGYYNEWRNFMLNKFFRNKVRNIEKRFFLRYGICVCLLVFGVVSAHADEQLVKRSPRDNFSREKQVLEINKNLKHLIEENKPF